MGFVKITVFRDVNSFSNEPTGTLNFIISLIMHISFLKKKKIITDYMKEIFIKNNNLVAD